MILDAEDRQDILEVVGELATLGGGETLLVAPPEYGDPQVRYSGEELKTMNPYCLAAKEDITALGITAGESGTRITVMGRECRVLSIRPSRSGFSAMELGTV